jgi:hypothetical protein
MRSDCGRAGLSRADSRATASGMRLPTTCLAVIGLALSLGACTSLKATGRFDSYGEMDGRRRSFIAVTSPDAIKVFYGTSPAGFSLRENELKVEPGYNHRIIGTARAVFVDGNCALGDFTKDDVLAILRKTAQEAGGNAIIYVTSVVSDRPKDLCQEVKGATNDELGFGWVVVLADTPPPPEPAAPPSPTPPTAPEPPPPPPAPTP